MKKNIIRERANSDSNIEKYLKRKNRNDEEGNPAFKRSSILKRSPIKNSSQSQIPQTEMEQILEKLKKLDEIQDELRDVNKQTKDLARSHDDFKDEVKKWMKDVEASQRQLEDENHQLQQKVQSLEKKFSSLEKNGEARDKRDRKNNIIITEKPKIDYSTPEEVCKRVKEIIEHISGKEIKIEESYIITKKSNGTYILKAKLSNFQNKIDTMKNKHKLKGTDIYIEDDYTKKEAQVQSEIRKKVMEERKSGNKVKMGYQKICINGIWQKWSSANNQ